MIVSPQDPMQIRVRVWVGWWVGGEGGGGYRQVIDGLGYLVFTADIELDKLRGLVEGHGLLHLWHTFSCSQFQVPGHAVD